MVSSAWIGSSCIRKKISELSSFDEQVSAFDAFITFHHPKRNLPLSPKVAEVVRRACFSVDLLGYIRSVLGFSFCLVRKTSIELNKPGNNQDMVQGMLCLPVTISGVVYTGN